MSTESSGDPPTRRRYQNEILLLSNLFHLTDQPALPSPWRRRVLMSDAVDSLSIYSRIQQRAAPCRNHSLGGSTVAAPQRYHKSPCVSSPACRLGSLWHRDSPLCDVVGFRFDVGDTLWGCVCIINDQIANEYLYSPSVIKNKIDKQNKYNFKSVREKEKRKVSY